MEKNRMTAGDFDDFILNQMPPDEVVSVFGITLKNIVFIENFFSNNIGITLSFEDCIFEGRFTLLNYLPNATTYITRCEFLGDIYFEKVNSVNKISFLDCSLSKNVIFNKVKLDKLELNNKFCGKLIFNDNNSFEVIEIGGRDSNKIEHLSLPANIIQNKCTINQANILKLRISYSTLNKELNIFNCNINFLELDNFRNNGVLRLLNCKAQNFESIPSEFLISRSNLSKAEFYNFDFASFTKVNIINSILLDSLYISSSWARNIISIDPYTQPPASTQTVLPRRVYASVIREVYKQIKFAMSKQGNFIEEQYFHGLEMNAYDISLSFKSDFWTKAVLKLSLWTSNYGQSFLRPLLTLILVNIPLLVLLKYELGFRIISLDNITIQDVYDVVANCLWFTNPIHKNDPELNGLPLIIDIALRIVSSYSIYNIIRASRRFIK